MHPWENKHSAIAVRALLVLAALAVGLVLVEVLLRLQEPRFHLMGARGQLGRYAAHPVWHHWLRPGSTTRLESFNKVLWPEPMIWTVNSQGCRHRRDLLRRPPAGVKRIIVMGDSFTEGYYEDNTFAAVLERRLYRAGGPVLHEVVNCGTSSYSPLIHYLRYKHQLSNYHPAELIVNVDLTDIYDDNQRYASQASFAPDGEPLEALPQARGFPGLMNGLRYRFYFARLLFGSPPKYAPPFSDEVFAYHYRLTPDSVRWQQEVGVSLSHLQRLIDLTRSQGVELTFTMYPYKYQLRPSPEGVLWHRGFEYEVKKLAERNRVNFYSAFDSMLYYVNKGDLPIYWLNDFHFTPTGQLIWSSGFADHYVNARR
jgi:lysophospholipase L1-like esterase